jgi:oligoendopeptidase F
MKQKNRKSRNNNKNNPSKNIKGEVWDIEPILNGKDFDGWIKEINSKVETFKKFRTQLNNNISPQKILEIIRLDEEIMIGLSRIDAYYSLKFCMDTKDSGALAKLSQIKQILAQVTNGN